MAPTALPDFAAVSPGEPWFSFLAVCTVSADVAGVLLQHRPGVVAEPALRFRVEAGLPQDLLEGRGIDAVEGEALAFQGLLQIDVQLRYVVPLLAGRLAETLAHHLLYVDR